MRILVNHPDLNLLGGVSNHYSGLREHLTEMVIYNTIGGRNKLNQMKLLWLLVDIIKFMYKLIVYKPDVVLLNPSLGRTALCRDFIFLRIAKFFQIPVTTFIHGFSWEYAQEVDPIWISSYLNRNSLIFVLANSFKKKLRELGVCVPITVTTTKVNDALLDGICVRGRDKSSIMHLLYVARIHKSKGIYETIQTFELLADCYPLLELTIAGNGPEFENIREIVDNSRFRTRIHIRGDLREDLLREEYEKADLYILPTTHGEGMPTSVLEAMAFGLPVFTRKVGGLVDFFNENMGYITDSVDPRDFASAIEVYLNDIELYHRVSEYNRLYAQPHFMASQVALDIEQKIKKYVFDKCI